MVLALSPTPIDIRIPTSASHFYQTLGFLEGYHSVNTDGLLRIGESTQMGMKGDALAGQPVQAILDRTAG